MARNARYSSRVDVIAFIGCMLLALIANVLPANLRDPLAGALRRTFVAPLISLQQGSERWRSAWLERDRRAVVRDTLSMRAFKTTELEVENDRLRRLLGLGAKMEWGFIPAEAIHSPGRVEDPITTLTLTAGANSGIQRYSPVVAPEGIVGMVQTTDPTMSIAIAYSHPDFRVSAMSADGSAFGIAYPHLEAGPQRYLLELRNVPYRTSLKPGTVVYSSGLGGTYPRGIPIGTVLREMKTTEGWSRTYLVQPAVNPAHVTSVMILRPQRVAQSIDNVWARVSSIDSATRGVAAAGDSLARQAALAEAAARRAALDSVRALNPGDTSRTDSARVAQPPRTDSTRPRVRPRPRVDSTARPRPDSVPKRDSLRGRP